MVYWEKWSGCRNKMSCSGWKTQHLPCKRCFLIAHNCLGRILTRAALLCSSEGRRIRGILSAGAHSVGWSDRAMNLKAGMWTCRHEIVASRDNEGQADRCRGTGPGARLEQYLAKLSQRESCIFKSILELCQTIHPAVRGAWCWGREEGRSKLLFFSYKLSL